jgi:hypothetical protein
MGGNAPWLEAELQAFGEEVMYVGDHIYGDILRSKKNVSWHTLLLIPELASTLERLEDQAGELQDFVRFETVRRKSELRLSLLEDNLRRNQEHRRVLAPGCPGRPFWPWTRKPPGSGERWPPPTPGWRPKKKFWPSLMIN